MAPDSHSLPPDESLLIDRWLDGDLSAADRDVVEARIAADPALQAQLAAVREVTRSVSGAPALPESVARAWAQRIVGTTPVAGTASRTRSIQNAQHWERKTTPNARQYVVSSWIIAEVVATVLAVLGIGRAVISHGDRSDSHSSRYVTGVAQRATVRLADGSTALLAPATTMTVAGTDIQVIGEAYFTVVSKKNRAIVVRTGNLMTRVLGTRFGVRHYPQDRESRVAVDDGKVSVAGARIGGTPIILSSGTTVRVTDSGAAVHQGDTRDYTAWTRGELAFTAVPLRDVIQEIARTYGADIRITDSAAMQRPITLSTSGHEIPLTEVLSQLAFMVESHVVQQGKTFVIVSGRAPLPALPKDRTPLQEKSYGR